MSQTAMVRPPLPPMEGNSNDDYPGLAAHSGPPMPPMPPMPPQDPSQKMAMAQRAVQSAQSSSVPTLKPLEETTVTLPAGWLDPNGVLHQTARVRELNGYDEEALSHFDPFKNIAEYITELLIRGVEELGGEKPSKQIIQSLLIGDREALMLGVRRATYGNNVEFKLNCAACDNESDVVIELDKDVQCNNLEDPLQRSFEVELKNGAAKVRLLNGTAQEAFTAALTKKTSAEINTLMLYKSVIEINGVMVMNDAQVKELSKADRDTLIDFISEHQPGPKLRDIPVPCATCREEQFVSLGLGNLFRL